MRAFLRIAVIASCIRFLVGVFFFAHPVSVIMHFIATGILLGVYFSRSRGGQWYHLFIAFLLAIPVSPSFNELRIFMGEYTDEKSVAGDLMRHQPNPLLLLIVLLNLTIVATSFICLILSIIKSQQPEYDPLGLRRR